MAIRKKYKGGGSEDNEKNSYMPTAMATVVYDSTPIGILNSFSPNAIADILTFYSPLIITFMIIALSFIFQNLKGLGFIIWFIIFFFLRNLVYIISGSKGSDKSDKSDGSNDPEEDKFCNVFIYSSHGNDTFSMFFIPFSLLYLCLPMFINKNVNYWFFSVFLLYFFIDIFIRFSRGCVKKASTVVLNTIFGVFCGGLSVISMYLLNLQKYLFFNEMSTTKDVCTMPSKQTFKCRVYKNGELMGTSTV
jgi:hypothetical protein